MPKRKVHSIWVIDGEPDDRRKKVKKDEAIVWIPQAAFHTLDVDFKSGSPFNTNRFLASAPGNCVGAVVTNKDDTYTYTLNVISLDGIRTEAEPQIIVDTGGLPPTPLRTARKGKGATKTAKGGRKQAGKKKAGKKKAGKRR